MRTSAKKLMKHGSNFRQPQHRTYYIAGTNAEQLRHQRSLKKMQVCRDIQNTKKKNFLNLFLVPSFSVDCISQLCLTINLTVCMTDPRFVSQSMRLSNLAKWLQKHFYSRKILKCGCKERERQIAVWIVTTTCNQTVINYITLGLQNASRMHLFFSPFFLRLLVLGGTQFIKASGSLF